VRLFRDEDGDEDEEVADEPADHADRVHQPG
jgi:predicted small metal-binding protein